MKTRTTWREKLEKKMEPVIKQAPEKWIERYGGDKMLIPTPLLVDEVMKMVPEGKLITIGIIRNYLAEKFNTDFTCPLTTGIFARIAAEAAEEDRKQGKKDITPYWRLLKDDGTLNPKFPGGYDNLKKLLENEGFEVVKKGKTKMAVNNFKEHLVFLGLG